MSTLESRITGALIGLAAGDRIGGPVRMALQLAKSLVTRQSFDPEDVLLRYLMWWRKEGFDTGAVAASVFTMVAQGVPYQEAVLRVHDRSGGMTAGCNPVHRSVPLAMAGFLTDTVLPDTAQEEAALTHHDPLAGQAAGWSVKLCRELMNGADWTATIKNMPYEIHKIPEDAETRLKSGGFAPDVLYAAVYFVNQQVDFAAALNASIEFAGAANFCPVLTGALAGARWGRDRIPDSALKHCSSILPDVEATAATLVRTWK